MKKVFGLLFVVAGVVAGYYFWGMKPPATVSEALMSYDRAKFATLEHYYISLAGAGLVVLAGVFFTLKK